MNKTFIAKKTDIIQNWYIISAKGKVLGRFASFISKFLIGKHKEQYTPHIDIGDYIIIIHAEKIIVTGNKFKKKLYYKHTGYPGGIKFSSFEEIIKKNPTYIIKKAVKGMLPKGSLGRTMYKKMKVYVGNYHKHAAQKPKILNFQ